MFEGSMLTIQATAAHGLVVEYASVTAALPDIAEPVYRV